MPRVSKGVFPFLFSPLPHPFLFFSPFLPTPVPLPTLLSLFSLSLSFSLCLSSSPLPAFPPLSSFLFQGPPEKCTSHTRERSKLACYWAPVNGDDGPFREELSKWCPLFSTPPPHFFFFCFRSPPLYPLPPPLLSPAYPLSWTPQFAVAAQVLTHTFSGQPLCLRMTLPGQEQWSNLSFLPELTTALAVAAALFSSRERGCKENWSKLWASSLHSHSLTCKHSTRSIPDTYRTSQ